MTRRTAALTIVAAIYASLAAAQGVKVDWDRTASFARYETFFWAGENALTGNTLLDQRIVSAVDTLLHARGLRCGEAGDLWIAAHVATSDRAALNGFYADWRGSDWSGVGATGIVDELTRGTLIVDIFDARTGQLVWRGTATGSVSNNPEKSHKNIQKAVEKMFKNFPPTTP
jgi:Domain of unknown function (DUF4136)